MIKGVIFDADGTTLETLSDIQNAINSTLIQFGFPKKTYDEVRLAVGRGSKILVEETVPQGTNKQTIEEVYQVYLQEYAKNYAVETKPYPGIKELLNKLQEKGIVLSINTNKPQAFIEDLVQIHFPNIQFIQIIGDSPEHPKKPDPYGCNEIVKTMGFNKEEILYIGDSESDVKTAKNAGLKCVGCLWGFRDLKTLQEAGANYIVKSPNEILDMLLSSENVTPHNH